jgi:uncharacterized membrane protein YkgB
MIDIIVLLILVCFAWIGGYKWGYYDGEKAMFREFTSPREKP